MQHSFLFSLWLYEKEKDKILVLFLFVARRISRHAVGEKFSLVLHRMFVRENACLDWAAGAVGNRMFVLDLYTCV
jgi:hypothetical protein